MKTLIPKEISSRTGLLTDAPEDDLFYCRKNGQWNQLPNFDGELFTKHEILRKLAIGRPVYHTSTTLPANHAWCDGSFISFSSHVEFKEKYNTGGFDGMVLPYNASSTIIANNLGKFRLDAKTPTGLYLPTLSDAFIRSWSSSLNTRDAGSNQLGAMQNLYGTFSIPVGSNSGGFDSFYPLSNLSGVFSGETRSNKSFIGGGWDGGTNKTYKAVFNASNSVNTSTEFRPPNTSYPMIIYLGL